MNKLLSGILMSILILGALAGCGKGDNAPLLLPSSAKLTLSSSGTGTIYGIDTTITLPAGVTVKSTVNPPETDSGAVTAIGGASGSLSTGVYTAATATAPGTVRVTIANEYGFAPGDFANIKCDISLGHLPGATDFGIASFVAKDENGNVIPGITAGYSAGIR